ncbi:MAG TPA: hypothetical protein IAB03_03615 [Candidatus Gallibacteroides avistercoris]|uniref:Uncharacterized protein n=1 Tax=Candidatus Gallibacteroides avistercoris TaxID=2840833 RepID=A0A9D1M6U4_9BACT|nr:hypothetical protein [Candidatus Gallibacteroides avistercoris]
MEKEESFENGTDAAIVDDSGTSDTSADETFVEPDAVESTVLVESLGDINTKMDSLVNLNIIFVVGLALLVGCLCCSIFSKYFHG